MHDPMLAKALEKRSMKHSGHGLDITITVGKGEPEGADKKITDDLAPDLKEGHEDGKDPMAAKLLGANPQHDPKAIPGQMPDEPFNPMDGMSDHDKESLSKRAPRSLGERMRKDALSKHKV